MHFISSCHLAFIHHREVCLKMKTLDYCIGFSQKGRHRHQCWLTLLEISLLNTLRPRQNGRHFADDIFKCIFLNENISVSIKILLKFVPKGPINNISPLVQIMAWRRTGDKPLSEPVMVRLLTHKIANFVMSVQFIESPLSIMSHLCREVTNQVTLLCRGLRRLYHKECWLFFVAFIIHFYEI